VSYKFTVHKLRCIIVNGLDLERRCQGCATLDIGVSSHRKGNVDYHFVTSGRLGLIGMSQHFPFMMFWLHGDTGSCCNFC